MQFRKDINGLRAIAIIAVVLFHFNNSWLPGGFTGVDVFFVISGYLMTSIIFTKMDKNTFSLFQFYSSRIKRIVPALIAVSAIIIVLGFLFIEPMSYQMIGKHSKYSLLFISNVIYKNEAGYFDVDSSKKYFLHTWSLSVEWQFYLLYPLLISFITSLFSNQSVKKIVLALTIIMFIINIYVTKTYPTLSYYMIYTRAWEMLFGGLAFLYPLKEIGSKSRGFLSLICLAGLVVSFLWLNDNTPWPGSLALIPVFLTYSIILLNGENRFLSSKPAQKIGLISYSLYLVHWPLVVFNKSLNLNLSFLSYLFIATSISLFIYSFFESKKRNLSSIFLLYSLLFVVSWTVSITGISSRVKPDFQLTRLDFRKKFEGHSGIATSNEPDYFNATENDFDYILIGDSHARHYFEYIKNNKKVVSFALDGCTSSTENYYPLSYSLRMTQLCKDRYQKQVDFINSHPDKTVIISKYGFGLSTKTQSRENDEPIGDKKNWYALGLQELDLFIKATKSKNRKYFVIGNTPTSKDIMFECLAKENLPINNLFKITNCSRFQPYEKDRYNKFLSDNAEKLGFIYIDPKPALCDAGSCMIIKGNIPIYTDTGHLSKLGSVIVGKYIFAEIKRRLSFIDNSENIQQ